MACSSISLPGGGYGIVCGLPAPKLCEFCGGIGDLLCDWPVEKFVPTQASELRVGDRIRMYADEQWGSEVVYTSRDGGDVYLGIRRMDGVLKMAALLIQGFEVFKTSSCDARCCVNCARAVDEEVHHCKSHWDSWRLIA